MSQLQLLDFDQLFKIIYIDSNNLVFYLFNYVTMIIVLVSPPLCLFSTPLQNVSRYINKLYNWELAFCNKKQKNLCDALQNLINYSCKNMINKTTR